MPPWSDFWLRVVRRPEGRVISKAPSRLKPKAMKTAAMTPLTQRLEPSWTTPKGPRIAVTASPRPEKARRCRGRRPPPADYRGFRRTCRFRKYDIVIGIIGKTQGVKMEARPRDRFPVAGEVTLLFDDLDAIPAIFDEANGAEGARAFGVVERNEDLIASLVADAQPAIDLGEIRNPVVDERKDHDPVDQIRQENAQILAIACRTRPVIFVEVNKWRGVARAKISPPEAV